MADYNTELLEAQRIFDGSNGDETKALYDRLAKLGPVGNIALNLFRANKNSVRAKAYRGGIPGKGSYRRMAYDRKNWAMDNLGHALHQHAAVCGLRWGWGIDPSQRRHAIVLFVDLPTGQVSFHTEVRGLGPNYPGQWDGVRGQSTYRICRWVARLLSGEEARAA
jgi:hypothetical protein